MRSFKLCVIITSIELHIFTPVLDFYCTCSDFKVTSWLCQKNEIKHCLYLLDKVMLELLKINMLV